jgi:hypothetical protein
MILTGRTDLKRCFYSPFVSLNQHEINMKLLITFYLRSLTYNLDTFVSW